MAAQVTLAQALSYARDLKTLHRESQARERELEEANRDAPAWPRARPSAPRPSCAGRIAGSSGRSSRV